MSAHVVEAAARDARLNEREREALLALYGAVWSRISIHAFQGSRARDMWREYRHGFARATAARVRALFVGADADKRGLLLYVAETASRSGYAAAISHDAWQASSPPPETVATYANRGHALARYRGMLRKWGAQAIREGGGRDD